MKCMREGSITYTDEMAEEICMRLGEGATLTAICADPDLPSRRTVYRWLDERPGFSAAFDRARERQADAHADAILAAADLPDDCTSAQVNAARLKVDALKWTAAHLRPARYAERSQKNVTVEVGGFAALLRSLDDRDEARKMTDITPVTNDVTVDEKLTG